MKTSENDDYPALTQIRIDFFPDSGIVGKVSGGSMKNVIIFLTFAVAILFCEACGDQPTGQSIPAPSSEVHGPRELGEALGILYVKAMQDLTVTIKDRPDPATIKQAVRELKESYIRQFVEFGKKRATMNQADRATVDTTLRIEMNKFYHVPWLKTYNDAQMHYAQIDPEFHQLILDFNIITQYADFELLKKQAPEEAKRLGIE